MKQPRGAAAGDLLFFLFFLIVLGVVWAMTGGPGRNISHAGPFLNLPFPLGNGTAYTVPSVPIPTPQQVQGGSSGGSATTNESLSDIIARLRGSVSGTKGVSPSAGMVTLSASNAQSTDPKTEYLTLRVSQNQKGSLAVSNWRIESAISLNGTVLGPASYLPISGSVGSEVPVSLAPGATVYLVTGHSPEGESFRKNLCTGYFTNAQSFTPSLSIECPRGKDELKKAAQGGFIPSEACINYVNGIASCRIGTKIPTSLESQCLNFISTALTYNGCVTAHKNDSGFYKNEWYIYLDRNQELWRSSNEQIRLLDENGKVVASVSY